MSPGRRGRTKRPDLLWRRKILARARSTGKPRAHNIHSPEVAHPLVAPGGKSKSYRAGYNGFRLSLPPTYYSHYTNGPCRPPAAASARRHYARIASDSARIAIKFILAARRWKLFRNFSVSQFRNCGLSGKGANGNGDGEVRGPTGSREDSGWQSDEITRTV